MKLYLNFAFLENLLLAEEQTDRHFYIKKLLSSPQTGIELIVDFDPEEAYKDPERRVILRQVAQKLPVWNTEFLTDCLTKEFHEAGESKLFFVDDTHLLIEKQYGCFCVSTTCLEKADFLFSSEEFRIDKNQKDWSNLRNIKHPCNALVLTDNYLFSNKKNISDNTYLENVKSLCEALIPASLKEGFKFDFTIIGFDSNNLRAIHTEYNTLSDYFQKQFPYPVNLTIIRDTYHDRYLFTNYYRIASGQGFALFKNQRLLPGKETTVHCKAITHEGRLSSADQTRREELQKCIASNRTERMPDRFAGSRQNRLLQ